VTSYLIVKGQTQVVIFK